MLRPLFVTDTNPVDSVSHQRQIIAAAHAAASWARARRAAWSPSPLGPLPAPSADPEIVAPKRELPVVVAFGLPAPQPQRPALSDWAPPIPDEDDFTAGGDVPEIVPKPSGHGAAARAFAFVRAVRIPIGRSIGIAAIGALVLTVGVTVKAYWSKGAAKAKAAVNALDSVVAGTRGASGPRDVETPRKTTGRLELTSEPAGAHVLLDGKARGVTPLTIDELAPGTHAFELQSNEGSIRRTVVIKAGETAAAAESIFGGFVKVFAPFEVTISESGKVVRLEEGNQIMLPAGRHELHFVNRTLGYESVHRVEVKPGETASISLPAPASTITVNASAASEVWLDGVRVGETPLAGVPVNVGTHDVIVRRADGDERRSTVTVTVKPITLEIDFSKP